MVNRHERRRWRRQQHDCRLVRVICDHCRMKQWNAKGTADSPASCLGCGYLYGVYA